MTLAEFACLLETHGADPRRWPATVRPAAEALCAASAEARALRRRAAALEAAFARDRATLLAVPPGRDLVAAALRQARVAPARRGWLGRLRLPGTRLAAGLAAAALAGWLTGIALPPSEAPAWSIPARGVPALALLLQGGPGVLGQNILEEDWP